MSDQIIPNTENARVAAVAAALELVIAAHRSDEKAPQLDELTAEFQRAYRAVRIATVQAPGS